MRRSRLLNSTDVVLGTYQNGKLTSFRVVLAKQKSMNRAQFRLSQLLSVYDILKVALVAVCSKTTLQQNKKTLVFIHVKSKIKFRQDNASRCGLDTRRMQLTPTSHHYFLRHVCTNTINTPTATDRGRLANAKGLIHFIPFKLFCCIISVNYRRLQSLFNHIQL